MPGIEDRKKMFKILKEKGHYDGDTFEDFEADFSSPNGQQELYNYVSSKKLYVGKFEDFALDYYSDVNQAKVEKKKDVPQGEAGGIVSETGLPEPLPQENVETPSITPEVASDYLVNNGKITPESLAELSLRMQNAFGNPQVFEQQRKDAEADKNISLQVLEERKAAGDIQDEDIYAKMKIKADNTYQEKLKQINESQKIHNVLWENGIVDHVGQALSSLKDVQIDFPKTVNSEKSAAIFDKAKNYLKEKEGWYKTTEEIAASKIEEEKKKFTSELVRPEEYRTQMSDAEKISNAINEAFKDSDLSDNEKSAMRTYLMSELANERKVVKINNRLDETMKSLGLPSPKDFEKDVNIIEGIQSNVNKQVAEFKGKFEAQAKLLDDSFAKKTETWKNDAQSKMDVIQKTYQEAVNNGEIPVEKANEMIRGEHAKLQAQYKTMYDDYMVNRSAIQKASANEFGKIQVITKDYQKKIDELSKKYKLKDGQLPEEYKQKYNAIIKSLWEEEDLTNKAKRDEEWNKMNYLEKSIISLGGGFRNLAESVFNGWKYFAPGSEIADIQIATLAEARENAPAPDFGEKWDYKNLLNADWYVKNVGEQLPIMGLLMGVGGVAFKAGTALAGKALPAGASALTRLAPGFMGPNTALSLQARQMVGSVVGGAASRFVESNMEAHNASIQALKEGKTYEEAMQIFKDVRDANMYLVATDAIQTYMMFAKAPKILATPPKNMSMFQKGLKNTFSYGGKMGVQIVTEGFEETYQEYQQALVNNPFLSFGAFANSDAGKEIFWVGGAMGAGMHAVSGGFKDRSAIAQINKQVKDYYKMYNSKDIKLEDIQNRLHQIRSTIQTLEAQGVLTQSEIGDAMNILEHNNRMYEQAYRGIVPFSYDSPQFNEYSSLVWEHEQLRKKAEGLDQQVPNEDTSVEKDVIKDQMDNIHKRVMELIKNPEVASYSYGDTPMTKDEFESLVFDPENKEALDFAMAQTNDPEILSRMRSEGIQKEAFIANAENYIDQNFWKPGQAKKSEGVTDEVIDNAINQAQGEYDIAKQKMESMKGSIGFPAALDVFRNSERNLEDLKYYKEQKNKPLVTPQADVTKVAEVKPMESGKGRIETFEIPQGDVSVEYFPDTETTSANLFVKDTTGKESKGIPYMGTNELSEDYNFDGNSILPSLENIDDVDQIDSINVFRESIGKDGNPYVTAEVKYTDNDGFEQTRASVDIPVSDLRFVTPQAKEEVVEETTKPVEEVQEEEIPEVEVEAPTTQVEETVSTEKPAAEKPKTEPKPVTERKPLQEPTKEKDTPKNIEQDLKRGYRVAEGQKYVRPEVNENVVVGEKSGVRFSPKDKIDAEWVVMESGDVQQSHMKGQPNMNFFLGQAQPKSRGAGEFMAKTGQLKAQNLDPEALGFSPNAYYGAPIVNERGEVIQGNGRTEAIKIAYGEYASEGEAYKQYLIDNAAKFGLDADAIANMEKPMLVRRVKVSDAEAIRLGQFQSSELEDVGGAKTEAIGRVRRLTPEQLDKLMRAFEGQIDTTKSLRDIVRNIKVMRAMREVGAITDQEFSDGTDGNTVRAVLVQKGVDFFNQLVLEGAIPELANELDRLPLYVTEGIENSIRSLLTTPEGKEILPDLHMAIIAAREYDAWKRMNLNSPAFTFDMWAEASTLTDTSPNNRYTPVQIELARFLMETAPDIAKNNSKITQKQAIADFFKNYNEKVQTVEGDMFTAEIPGMSKVQAINQILNTNISEDGNNARERELGGIVEETTGTSERTGGPEQEIQESEATTEPVTTVQELEVNRDETEGAIVESVEPYTLFDEMVASGEDPITAMDTTLELEKQNGATDTVLEASEEGLEDKVILEKVKQGITTDAAKVEMEVNEDIDAKELEEQAKENDRLLEEAILPDELSNELIDQLYQAGLIDEDTMFYAKRHLTNPNDITRAFHDEALSKLPEWVESMKTSKEKKPKAKKETKEKKPRATKPKTVKEKKSKLDENLDKAKNELNDLLNKLKGGGGIQKSGGVTVFDIVKAGTKYSYYAIEKMAETYASNPEKINKTTWKQEMLSTFGDVIEPYLDQMWEMPVPPSVNENTPILADHAANIRKVSKTKATEVVEEGVPESKQSKPKVVKRQGTERPPITYVNYEKMPDSVDEYVPEGRYGTELDEHQRYATNLALTNFLSNNQRGFMLGDSMGVGKTRQMIATAVEYAKRTGKPVLIVTQNSQIIDTAFAPDATAMGLDLAENKVKVITYSQLAKESGNQYGLVIYDEAQNLKNPSQAFDNTDKVISSHVMYSTATPGDKVGSAIYFLSDLLGVPRKDLMKELGVKKSDDGNTWEMTGSKSEKQAVEIIDEYIQKLFEDGKIIRREYPFWGTTGDSLIPLDSAQVDEIDQIRMAYDQQIDSVRPGPYMDQKTGEMKYSQGRRAWDKRYTGLSKESADALDDKIMRDLREQKINMLDKVVETYKAKMTLALIKRDLAEGKSVVVTSQNVNEINVRGIGGDMKNSQKRESFLQELKALLDKAKIPYVEITGNTDKTQAVQDFQDGKVKVVIGSMQSMSTGINLDDVVGDSPRMLYVAGQGYDANVLNQVMGRVSRRNTKTPAKVVFLIGNTESDRVRQSKVNKKSGILGVFQGYGIDEDTRTNLSEEEQLARNRALEKKKPYIEVYEAQGSIVQGGFILVKDSYDIKNILKGIGAKPHYVWETGEDGKKVKKFAGWRFGLDQQQEVQEIIDKYNAGELDLNTLQKARANYQFAQTTGTTPNREATASMQKMSGPPKRIDVMPTTPAKPKKVKDIIKDIRKRFKVFIKYGKPIGAGKAAGTYQSINSAIHSSSPNDIDVIAHELGHYLDDRFQIAPKDDSLDDQLKDYWIYGSAPAANNPNPQQYRRAEAIAEYVRAMIYNPAEAKARNPELWDLVMSKIPDDIKQALNETSQDIRELHGSNIVDLFAATMYESEADASARRTFFENRKKWWDDMMLRYGLNSEGVGNFEINWWDKMSKAWSDQLAPMKKAMDYLQKINGVPDEKITPAENPYTLARLFAGLGSKINNIFKKGAVGLDPKKGYFRLTDPETKQNITLNWLLEPIQTVIEGKMSPEYTGKNFKEKNVALRNFKNYVGHYMTAERTLELAKRFGREDKLTGIGKPIIGKSDVQAAKEFLQDFEQRGEGFKDQVKEAARRYRVFSDTLLRYELDHGLISQDQLDYIKANNDAYVALQRVMGADAGISDNFLEKSGGMGEALIGKEIKGADRDRIDPYVNLFSNYYKIVEFADKNYVYNSFVDMLRSNRSMYEGEITPSAEIGRRVAVTPDMNISGRPIIVVYNKGVKEYWELHPDVYESLKSMTESAAINPVMAKVLKVTGLYTKLIRFAVTKNPVFSYLRNLPRDIQARLVQSRTLEWPGKGDPEKEAMREAYIKMGMDPDKVNELLDSMKMPRGESVSMYELYGGDQAGYYTKSREHYYAAMDRAIRAMAAKGNIVLDPKAMQTMWDKYEDFLAVGERSTRVNEYRTAYNYAIKKLGYDEYNASLYAAFQSRDLMDFAVVGSYMEIINKIVPFSNASMQGTLRTLKGIAEDYKKGGLAGVAKNTGARWFLVNGLPHLFFIMLAKSLGYDDEYKDLPAYQKDMFYNFKIPSISTDVWITIPKPFELGITGTGLERLYEAVETGDFGKAFQGYGGSLYRAAMPFSLSDFMSFYKAIQETQHNYSEFYQSTIIPAHEEQLNVDLRKGKGKASYLGKILGGFAEVDPRKVDYVIKNWFSYFGDLAMSTSNIFDADRAAANEGVSDSYFNLSMLGIFKDSVPQKTRSVQYMFKNAKEFRLWDTDDGSKLKELLDGAGDFAGDNAAMERYKDMVLQYSKNIEKKWKINIPIYQRFMRGEEVEYNGVKFKKDGKGDPEKRLKNVLFNN